MGQDQDDTVVIPYTTVQKQLLGVQHVIQHHVSAEDGAPHRRRSTAAIADLLRQRHRIQPRRRRRLHRSGRMEEIATHADVDHDDDDLPAGEHRGGLAAGRRHRHHEHHAGVGHRADARDRPAHGGRRARPRRADAVPGRGDRPQSLAGGAIGIALGFGALVGVTRCCSGPTAGHAAARWRCRSASPPRSASSSASTPPARPPRSTPSTPSATSKSPSHPPTIPG